MLELTRFARILVLDLLREIEDGYENMKENVMQELKRKAFDLSF